MLDFTDLKLGKVINYNNAPCVIVKCQFIRKSMGKPVKKCTMKSLTTGSSTEYSFKAGESIEEADIRRERATYMYDAGDSLSFMLTDTYESVDINKEMLGGKEGYLTDGLRVEIIYFGEDAISVELPIKVTMTVKMTTDAAKGNTVSDVQKDATMETGVVLKVPNFIKIGERVNFNTVEDEYTGRESN
jgi:elongation factor P